MWGIERVLQLAWQQFQAQMLAVLPNLLAALFVFVPGVVFGVVIGRAAGRALVALRVDRHAARVGLAASLERLGAPSAATLFARGLQWAVILLAATLALYSLDPRVASDLTARVLLYLPHLAVAVLILGVGTVLSRFLARGVLIAAVNREIGSPRLLSGLARAGVMLVAVAAALEQVGIARTTVLIAFSILMGGATLAGAIAIGLGSQDLVRRWLADRFGAAPAPDEHETLRHL